MQVTFKTITQEQFQLDLSDDLTIDGVKQAIADAKGENFAVDNQKLIFNGKVLADEVKFSDIGYDEKKFIVLIVKKPIKPVEPEAPKVDEPAPVETPKPAEEPATPAAVPETPVNRPPVDTPAAPKRPIALSPENQEKLNNLKAMGYDEERASLALRAAFFNVERAVEYLLTGIPEHVAPMDLDEAGSETDEQVPAGLDFLNENEQFAQLRNLVRENPAMLPQIIQQIAADNPALMQLIRENEDQFLRILNGDEDTAGEQENDENMEVGVQPDAEAAVVSALQFTEADRAAINRLKDMGFPHNLVIEAYFACDRNEGLAVNYILQRMEEAYAEGERQS